jgi:hypothetical protein
MQVRAYPKDIPEAERTQINRIDNVVGRLSHIETALQL